MSAIFAWPQRRAAACALVFLHKWLFATLPQALILCRVDIVSSHSNRCEVSTFLTGLLFHQAVFRATQAALPQPLWSSFTTVVTGDDDAGVCLSSCKYQNIRQLFFVATLPQAFFAFQIAHGIFFELCLSRLRRLSVVVIEQCSYTRPSTIFMRA